MSYAGVLRKRFPSLDPQVEDLLLLEAHQVAALPQRAPERELAVVLHAHPVLYRYLVARCPPIEVFLRDLLAAHTPVGSETLAAHEQALTWELADWIVYQRAPDLYDAAEGSPGDIEAVTEVVALDGMTVIDAGAGTGQLTLGACRRADHVFAVEPVASLRAYLRSKASRLEVSNLYVLDGLLSSIPLPPKAADVLITRSAIGWSLDAELVEIDRVLRPGGHAVHLLGVVSDDADYSGLNAALVAAGYTRDSYADVGGRGHRYLKRVGDGE